jgi:hypothetical protein
MGFHSLYIRGKSLAKRCRRILRERKLRKRKAYTEFTESAEDPEKRRMKQIAVERGGVDNMDGAEQKVDGERGADGWGNGEAGGVGEEDAAAVVLGAAEAGDADGVGGVAGCGVIYRGAASHGV